MKIIASAAYVNLRAVLVLQRHWLILRCSLTLRAEAVVLLSRIYSDISCVESDL